MKRSDKNRDYLIVTDNELRQLNWLFSEMDEKTYRRHLTAHTHVMDVYEDAVEAIWDDIIFPTRFVLEDRSQYLERIYTKYFN